MNKKQLMRQQRRSREKIVLDYLDAFEQDDFERLSQILQLAEQDTELETLLWEVHAEYQMTQEEEQYEQNVELVRQLIQQHIPSGLGSERKEEEIPPLTVSDVIAHMQAESAVKGEGGKELGALAQQLRQSSLPLPKNMGLLGVRKLFAELGIQASKHMQRLFSDAALILISRRDQGMAQLAATRKQQQEASAAKRSRQLSEEEQS